MSGRTVAQNIREGLEALADHREKLFTRRGQLERTRPTAE
jgi:hypothetical protein